LTPNGHYMGHTAQLSVTHPRIFSRLYTPILTILTKGFTQALPTSNITPTSYLHALHTLKRLTIVVPCPHTLKRLTTRHFLKFLLRHSHPEEIPRKKSKAQDWL